MDIINIGITPDQTTVYAEFYHGLRLQTPKAKPRSCVVFLCYVFNKTLFATCHIYALAMSMEGDA